MPRLEPIVGRYLHLDCGGRAYRVCEMMWLKGETIGVRFLRKTLGDPAQRRARGRSAQMRRERDDDWDQSAAGG